MRKIWTFIRSYAIKLSDIYSYCNLSWEKHLCVFVIFITVFGMKVKVVQSCLTLCYPMDCTVHGTPQARILEWVASSFSRGSSQRRGSNPGFLHCRQVIYKLSHRGSPRILQWVAYPFSSGSSRPRNWTGVSCTAGRVFTTWVIREAWKFGEWIRHK